MNINKLSSGLIILSLVFVGLFFIAPVVDAQVVSKLVPCGDAGRPDCTFKDLALLITAVIKFLIFQVGILVATIVIIWGGVLYVLYPYKPGYKDTAKKMITGSIVGLLIMMGAYLIVKTLVTSVVGPSADDANPADKADLIEAVNNTFQDLPNTSQSPN
ncbi:MAG: pilin [Candidatus Vogelbacteria bacterium]|nr:pilin [Candidatus Vogelbacteria bacterium]